MKKEQGTYLGIWHCGPDRVRVAIWIYPNAIAKSVCYRALRSKKGVATALSGGVKAKRVY